MLVMKTKLEQLYVTELTGKRASVDTALPKQSWKMSNNTITPQHTSTVTDMPVHSSKRSMRTEG
jgi:hypothetical protein